VHRRDGSLYTIAAAYDANSRVSAVTYPSGFAVNYLYTNLGYSRQLADAVTGVAYWTANARDAEQHLTLQTAGNGIVTTQGYDAPTGRLTSIAAGTSNAVANFAYTYDVLGDLTSRADANTSLSETFAYDALDRLISSTVNFTPTPLVKTFTYDPIGNLLSKSDVGTYAYPAAGAPRPHAVTSISGGFAYDANGNQTSGLGRTIGYTSFNKPSSIAHGTSTLGFFHDPEHQRFKQTAPEGITVYLDGFGVHVEYFMAGTNQWNEYLIVGGRMVGVRFERSDNTVSTRYFVRDHLGSVAVLTDENGLVVERLSYDAWGKRRFPNGADDPAGSITSQTSRGFTGQEELADVGLVHLNGRVYDPLIGRMMTADPMVPDPANGQAWNRYSYVINNPLSFTDPNGYCFLGLCGVFNAIGNFFRHSLGSIVQIAISAICVATPGCQPFLPLIAAAAAAFVAGVTTGRLDPPLNAGAQQMKKPNRDVIPDAAAAVKIGVAILEAYFGEKFVRERAPYGAILRDDNWEVGSRGEVPFGQMGGGDPMIVLSKRDACVLHISLNR
jgi:RHS repeat-associated protein